MSAEWSEKSHDVASAIVLEERAHRLRMAMLQDKEFMAGVREGYEAAERGDVIPLEELDRELGWND